MKAQLKSRQKNGKTILNLANNISERNYPEVSKETIPRRLFNFEALGRLKEGGAYFKVRGIICMKFQNFEIFSF